MVAALALAAWAAPPLPAQACTCAQTPLPEMLEEVDFAFVGTATAVFEPKSEGGVISSDDRTGYAFSVALAWKGVVTDTLTVWSPRNGSSCGYRFHVGQRYVVLGTNRRGLATTGMCSGNERLDEALAARYLLPEPDPIAPGATWPALSRGDLVDILRSHNGKMSPLAASLLSLDYAKPELEGLSLTQLLTADCTESGDILAAAVEPSQAVAPLVAFAYRLLEAESAGNRAAAIEGLGTLTTGDELVRTIRRGFADQAEAVRAAARQVMLGRYADLAAPAADECVAAFIGSLGAMPKPARWVGVHQLRFFPAQRDRIRPFLQAVADTATEELLRKTALDVLKALPAE